MKRIHFVSFHHAGHINSLIWMAKELIRRGKHHVVFSTFDPAAEKVSPERMCEGLDPASCYYEFVSMGFPGMTPEEDDAINNMVFSPDTPPPKVLSSMCLFFSTIARATVQGLERKLKENPPDLIVYDVMTAGAGDLAELLGIQRVLVTSIPLSTVLDCMNNNYQTLNNAPWVPLSSGPLIQPTSTITSSRWRILRMVLKPILRLIFSSMMRKAFGACRQELGLPALPIGVAINHTGLVLATEPYGRLPARPLPPNIVLVGPQLDPKLLAIADSESTLIGWQSKLTDEVKRWLFGNVVYIAFGTNVQLKPQELANLVAAISGVKGYRFLWSLPAKQAVHLSNEQIPENLKLLSWVNQPAVLRSPCVKVFISHCGANSVNEAQIFGVPILAMPMGADQPGNAMTVEDGGMGLRATPPNKVTASELQEKLDRIVFDDSFTYNAIKWGKIARFSGGAARAADHIEHMLEVGIQHLVPAVYHAPWWQRCNIDVAVAALVVVGASLSACWKVLPRGP